MLGPKFHTSTRRACAALAVALGASVAVAVPAVAVAPDAPVGLTSQPSGVSAVLSWDPVAGATKYTVQVDDDPAFGSPFNAPSSSNTTVNTRFVPTVALGTQAYWRVRAVNASNEVSGWVSDVVTIPDLAAPMPTSPVDGATLQQPGNPPLLAWSASPGADSYLVRVDDDVDLTDVTPYTTATTSLVVPDLLGGKTWYWSVQAKKGATLSTESDMRSFAIGTIPRPTLVSPVGGAAVQDVVLDWDPVLGAKSYDVQVATDDDFTVGDSLVLNQSNVLGTRYSPPTGLDNTTYYWRVRAVDVDGNAPDWGGIAYETFARTYPYAPAPVFPADPALETVGDPLYFEWQPVKHASEYQIQLGTDPNFSPDTFQACRVAGTTFTNGQFAINLNTGSISTTRTDDRCRAVAGQINYWRVRPLDTPFSKAGTVAGIQGQFSATQSFIYQPVSITNLSPAHNAEVAIPTLSWDPAVGASYYNVEVDNAEGARVAQATTRATTWTVPDLLKPADGPFTWRISATTAKGDSSVVYQRSFSVTNELVDGPAAPLAPLTPTPTTPGIQGAPQFTWEPYPGAVYYRVNVGNAMDSGQIWFGHASGDMFNQEVQYPTVTDTSARLATPGDYDWQVSAYNKDHQLIATGPESRFTVQPIQAVTGQVAAVNGSKTASGTERCTTSSGECTVPTTPVISWTPDPRASFYIVYVSRDASFTNLLEADTSMAATSNSMFHPNLSNRQPTYDDRLAGDAYYWHVRPCRAVQVCAPDPFSSTGMAQHSFKKLSRKPTGLTARTAGDPNPGDAVLPGTEVTFSWNDFLADNLTVAAGSFPRGNQSARQYRIQVDDDPSFGSPVDERVVDQTTYTAFDKIYDEGTYYWRVQAIDSAQYGLAWSDVQSFTKNTPALTLIGPSGVHPAGTTPAFRWNAVEFAVSYDIQVAKNADTTFASANLVVNKTARKPTAYTHDSPIPASATPYVWRVRRTDAKGNKGPWSSVMQFRVDPAVPNITSPANGGSEPATSPVATWDQLAGASTYTVAFTTATGATTESATTSALSYAATKRFGTGTYTLTVTGRDAGGATVGASNVSFTVDAGLTALVPTEIQAPEGTGVGATFTSTPPVWNQPDVTNKYEWLRNGNRISGASGETYVLQTADYGKEITLRVTGTKPNYDTGISLSNAIGGTAGGALQAVVQPTISGTPLYGQSLRVSPGTWSQTTGVRFRYQWLRTGVPIAGATNSTYRVTAEDAARNISVTVFASRVGFNDGAASAAAVSVPKLTSTTTALLSTSRTKPGKRVKIGITVSVPGVTGPLGIIKIMDGAKQLKQVRLYAFKNGKVTVKLPKITRKGKHKIKAVYLGTGQINGSKSKKLRLSVLP